MPQLTQNAAFIKAVAKYFMDFLETDFHKRRNPRRALKLRNSDNLILGVRLDKYPAFNSLVWRGVNRHLPSDPIQIAKGVYRADPPKKLLELVALQIDKIDRGSVGKVADEIANSVENFAVAHKDDFTTAVNKTVESTTEIMRVGLAEPFIANIEKSLQALDVADENSIFMMVEDLTDVLVGLVQATTESQISRIIADEKLNAQKELKSELSLDRVKTEINTFFDNLKTNDLFLELFEMDRNKNILDKQEFYLYFGDITYNQAKYPLFYLPLSVKVSNDVLTLEPDSQVFINKKSLEYIAQEYNARTGKRGSLHEVGERIIYLAQHTEDFAQIVQSVVDEVSNFFELDGRIDISKPTRQSSRSALVRVTNDLHIVLFDNSDEALINDYEELMMLEEDSPIAGELADLVEGFINKNPKNISLQVDESWSDLDFTDKLVSPNPIPLNSEQRKILMALNHEDCRYIAVEGPPGTGKSHTITAIVFNAILENKSVLVLSDKKEALDVVEDKITQTMNSVRFDSDFQNPILRLGKTGNTYRQILAPAAIDRIKASYLVMRRKYEELEAEIQKAETSLKEELAADKLSARNVSIDEMLDLGVIEHDLQGRKLSLDLQELGADENAIIDLEELHNILLDAKALAEGKYEGCDVLFQAKLMPKHNLSFVGMHTYLEVLSEINGCISSCFTSLGADRIATAFGDFPGFNSENLSKLDEFIQRIQQLRRPLIGFTFNKRKAEALDHEFQSAFPQFPYQPHGSYEYLCAIAATFKAIDQFGLEQESLTSRKLDLLNLVGNFSSEKNLQALTDIVGFKSRLDYASSILKKYPSTAALTDMGSLKFNLSDNYITNISELDFEQTLKYVSLKQKVETAFASMPVYDYVKLKKSIEQMVTTKMTYLMDGRLVDFALNHSADAKVLKTIIQSKEKFPREQFEKLKSAFPCILAGIRDYAEYIPMESGIFDLVIIDEASQVSIAQAFPALLRAKKVLILGDKLQFGNVKAMQAKSDINTEYVNSLRNVFTNHVSSDAASLKKLEYFNVKRSVLDFFGFISNYNIMLVKHFRGYKENISFSNKYFYQNNLQVMKIRGKKIDDVIMFQQIEHDGLLEMKANSLEVDHVLKELSILRDNGSKQSVGVITPHTNQQKKISDAISKDPNRDYYLNDLSLKIMTFDTCQGEERDIIYYSMVATEEDDRLQHIFSKDLAMRSDEDEEDSLRKQRMNVGFSRSKESMRFVLSKPIDHFRGAIGQALLHYQQVVEDAKRERSVSEVDQRSGMEASVLNWFYQTEFWNKNKDNIELNPQFELGKYLKQLDPMYHHPAYKVDFHLVYAEPTGKIHQVIIEYDGLKEHGLKRPVDGGTDDYESYYSEDDIYRQKVLESYGYKFLRINVFNLGSDPIQTLDARIASLLTGAQPNRYLTGLNQTAQSLLNGTSKECPNCQEILPSDQFKDAKLATGFGRICIDCKRANMKEPSSSTRHRLKPCPECGSKMKLRTGYRGKFYGCTRFPSCRGTRDRADVL